MITYTSKKATAPCQETPTQDSRHQKIRSAEPLHKNDNDYERNKHIKKLERQINELEQKIAKAETSFASLVYGTPEFNNKSNQLEKLKRELEELFAAWENLCS